MENESELGKGSRNGSKEDWSDPRFVLKVDPKGFIGKRIWQ